MSEQQPTRFEHAAILTEDPANPTADTMVIEGEKIAWIGRAEDLPEPYAGDACTAVDLAGARVIPGFIDAHMHALMLAGFSKKISALPPAVHSIEELVDAVRERRAEQGPDQWIEGWGYDEALLAEKRSPTRFPIRALPMGDSLLIRPWSTSWRTVVTTCQVSSSPSSSRNTVTLSYSPTVSAVEWSSMTRAVLIMFSR